jgi:hypothetical protein
MSQAGDDSTEVNKVDQTTLEPEDLALTPEETEDLEAAEPTVMPDKISTLRDSFVD